MYAGWGLVCELAGEMAMHGNLTCGNRPSPPIYIITLGPVFHVVPHNGLYEIPFPQCTRNVYT